MAKGKKGKSRRRGKSGGLGSNYGRVAVVIGLALVLAGGLIFLNLRGAEAPSPATDVATSGRTKGSTEAPVVMEVWSDFQ